MAHYLWPPQWVGQLPRWVIEPGLPVQRADLGRVITDAELPPGIRIRAFRDGMLAFDLGSWGDPVALTDASEEGFEAVAEYQVRCARLMNTHLACIHTTSRAGLKPTILTPGRIMAVRWSDGRVQSGSGVAAVADLDLWKARTGASSWDDWRLLSRGSAPITTEEMDESFDLLRRILDRPAPEVALLRAELLFRSAAAYSDHDSSAALVHAWTATEGLLGDLFADYIAGREGMNRKRRDFLKGADMTARITAEILSLSGWLPFPLYQSIVLALNRRNAWLHDASHVYRCG